MIAIRLILFGFTFFLILFPMTSFGVTSDTIGVGARAIGLGGAYTAVADDPTAIYYNPAGLAFQKGSHLNLGYLYGWPNLKGDEKRIDMLTDEKFHVAASWMFSGPLKDRLGIGLQIFMPTDSLFKLRSYGPYDPYFPLYENQAQSYEMRMGFAFRPIKRISFGFAVMLLSSMMAKASIYTPIQIVLAQDNVEDYIDEEQRMFMLIEADLPLARYYYAGILADLGKGLKAGIAYRDENYINVNAPFWFDTKVTIMQVPIVKLPVMSDTGILAKYSPYRISGGISYEKEKRFLISFALDYLHYKDYELPNAGIEVDVGLLEEMEDLTLQEPLVARAEFHDVWVPRIGAEYWISDWLSLRGGYAYERSPWDYINLPLYDNDKHYISGGAGLFFINLLDGAIPGETNIDLVFQTTLYQNRTMSLPQLKPEVISNWPEESDESKYPYNPDTTTKPRRFGGEVYAAMITIDVKFEFRELVKRAKDLIE